MTKNEIILKWRAGVLYHMLDTLSRLPHSRVPEADDDDVFPNDLTSRNLRGYAGPRGPTLLGMLLTDLTPASAYEEGSGKQSSAAPAGIVETSVATTAGMKKETVHQRGKKHPIQVAGAAAINPAAPTRWSTRQR